MEKSSNSNCICSPQGGSYTTPQSVVLTPSQTADIYYTTDGSTPTLTSNKYITALLISTNTVLKFLAINYDNNQSPVYTETYTIDQAPFITSTNPSSDATGVSLTSPVTITFSENIVAGANFAGIYIKNLNTGKTVTLDSKTISGNTLAIKQSLSRLSNNYYQVYIPAGAVNDTAGNSLAAAYILTPLKPAGTSDITPPTITSTNPTSNATGVSLTSSVIITFSENIVAGSNFASIYIKNLTQVKQLPWHQKPSAAIN